MKSHSAIVVTGAAGFIASSTTELLLRQNKWVIGIDNLNDSYSLRLKRQRLAQLKTYGKKFNFFKADIQDLRSLRNIFKQVRPQAVIHLAARAGVRYSLENPFVYEATNVLGTLNILEMCKEYSVKKFVLASTSSLYAHEALPFREDAAVNTPISPYAATKKAAEALCYTYHYLHGIDMTVFRYFTVYGPAGRPDMSYFKFIQQIAGGKTVSIYGDGRQERDFTYVSDIARGTVLGLKNVGYRVINLGGGKRYRLLELIHLIEKYTGKKARLKFYPENKTDMRNTWADNSRARRLLGWRPQVSLEEGVRQTVEWHQQNKQWLESVSLG